MHIGSHWHLHYVQGQQLKQLHICRQATACTPASTTGYRRLAVTRIRRATQMSQDNTDTSTVTSRVMTPGRLTAAFAKLLQQRTGPGQQQHSPPAAAAPPASCSQRRHDTTSIVSIEQSDRVQKLLAYATDLAPSLQPQQASLLLYVCAKCQLRPSQQLLDSLLQQLQPDSLHSLPPAGLVNAFWAVAVLQLKPCAAWIDAVYAGTAHPQPTANSNGDSDNGTDSSSFRSIVQSTESSTMSSTTSSSSSSSSSNTGSNGTSPSCHTTTTTSSGSSNSSSSCTVLCVLNPHQQVQLLWATGRLQQRPPAAWLQAMLAGLQLHLAALSPTELSNIIWALARIGFRPGSEWLGLWFRSVTRVLPSSSCHCIACQVASLGVLRLRLMPSRARWLVRLRAAVLQQLGNMQQQDLASILCGFAKLRCAAPPYWVRAVLTRQVKLLSSSGSSSSSSSRPVSHGPRDVAATVWSLPLLLHPTAVDWAADARHAALVKQLATISLPLLPECSVAELVQLAVGFARLGFYPGVHWLKSHENAVARHRLALTDVNRWRLQAAMRRLWHDD